MLMAAFANCDVSMPATTWAGPLLSHEALLQYKSALGHGSRASERFFRCKSMKPFMSVYSLTGIEHFTSSGFLEEIDATTSVVKGHLIKTSFEETGLEGGNRASTTWRSGQ
jgi:hypothetical protein